MRHFLAAFLRYKKICFPIGKQIRYTKTDTLTFFHLRRMLFGSLLSSEAYSLIIFSRFPDLQLKRINGLLLIPACPDTMDNLSVILAAYSDRIAQDSHLILFYPLIAALKTLSCN